VGVVLFVAFAVWWALLMLLFGLGRCGEDSDLTEPEDFRRLCGDPSAGAFDGVIFTNLAAVGAGAAAATVVLTGVAVTRRRWWPVAVLVIALLVAAGLGWNAEEL